MLNTPNNDILRESNGSNKTQSCMASCIARCFGLRSLAIMLAIAVVLLDQGSKWFVTKTLEYGETLSVFPSFSFTLRHNSGAAFSFLTEAGGWQRWFFVGIAAVVSAIIFIWLGRLSRQDKVEALGLSLILGGALGNVIDRLFYGYVVDFILVYYKDWQYPAFNIADMAISFGVFFFIYSMIRKTGNT